MSILLVILGILSFIGAGWYKIRQRVGVADRRAKKAEAGEVAAKIEAEAAQGEAVTAIAERTVIVEAMDDQAAGAAAAREVTRAAAEAVDHPDRVAARARARLPADVPDADDREGAGGGDTAELPPPRR